MRVTMRSPRVRKSGEILGLDRQVVSEADFVYDARGPRTSPAIEVQGWVEPSPIGRPYDDPTAVGLQALGFSVPEIAPVCARLEAHGCAVIGSGSSPFGTRWTTLRDRTGVALDVVDDPTIPTGASRMRHLRITVSDLGASVSWYRGLGFEVVGEAVMEDGSFLGWPGRARAELVRLRLPDEPYEAVLCCWDTPRSHGRHYSEPYHAGLFRVALGVDDTRASYESMVAEGWVFDRPPRSVELSGTPVPDMWICFLSDPDGVPIELVERPRSAFRP